MDLKKPRRNGSAEKDDAVVVADGVEAPTKAVGARVERLQD